MLPVTLLMNIVNALKPPGPYPEVLKNTKECTFGMKNRSKIVLITTWSIGRILKEGFKIMV